MTTVIPALPCPRIDDIIAFYEILGFEKTYRQVRPNPYAAVKRGAIELHFFGIDGFDPAESYGTCIVCVDDVDVLYRAFAASLRKAYGKLPVAGFPRITRPRKKLGMVRGFNVVDPGGNWIRLTVPTKDAGERASEKGEGALARALDAAARLGDAHGDPAAGAKVLDLALARHSAAPVGERAAALVYRVELALAMNDAPLAHARLADLRALPLTGDDREALAGELERARELEEDLASAG